MNKISVFKNTVSGKYEIVEQSDGTCDVPKHYSLIGFYVKDDIKKENDELLRENKSLKDSYLKVDSLIKKFNQLEKEKELLQNKFDFLMTLYKGAISELRNTRAE